MLKVNRQMGRYSSACRGSVRVCSTSPMVLPVISFQVAALLWALVPMAMASTSAVMAASTGMMYCLRCTSAHAFSFCHKVFTLRGTKWGKRSSRVSKMCMMGTNSTQPTLLNSTSGDTQARINSLASRESVSPTSNSMVGVRVESNFTKQYTSASAVA